MGTEDLAGQRNPLRKALQVLRWMVEDDPGGDWGVREIAQGLQMAPSTVHRVLSLLEEQGMMTGDLRTGRYRLGLEFLRLVWKASAGYPIHNAAVPILRDLVAACNETAFVGLYDPVRMEMMFVASVESQHPLRYVVELHKWLPVHVGASGLAIMAFLPAEEREAIIQRTQLAPVTELSITDRVRLEQEMERIRRQGYACTRGQRIPGAVGMGAPIWGPDGRVLGDMILTIPEQRFSAELEPRLARLLAEHAGRITARLGGRAAT